MVWLRLLSPLMPDLVPSFARDPQSQYTANLTLELSDHLASQGNQQSQKEACE